MPSRKIPSVRLRRIGSALRKAREARGMTIETVSRRYGRSSRSGGNEGSCVEVAVVPDRSRSQSA